MAISSFFTYISLAFQYFFYLKNRVLNQHIVISKTNINCVNDDPFMSNKITVLITALNGINT